jgi:hypothetical protein
MLWKTNPDCAEERTNPPTQALEINPFATSARHFSNQPVRLSL